MLGRAVRHLTSPHVLRLIAVVGVTGGALGLAVHLATNRSLVDRNGEPIGGDFISPYAAGRLVLEGAGARLYDLRLQQRTQGRIIGRPEFRGLCSFVNPPVVAVALAPLALLPFHAAYCLYTGLLLVAYLLGLWFLRPHLPAFRDAWGTVAGLGLLFYPMAITITGGQNTALTFLLLAGAYGCLRRGRAVAAGALLGLLLYKPQFALLPLLLVATQRRYRTLASAGAVAALLYLVGAAVCGFDWPLVMMRSLNAYWPLENRFNGRTSIALVGVCDAAIPHGTGRLIGMILSVAVAGLCLHGWRCCASEGRGLNLGWALAVSGGILVSPHTQWYDAGLLLLSALLVLDARLARAGGVSTAGRAALVAGFCVPPMFGLGETLGFQPVFVLALAGFAWTWWEAVRGSGAGLPLESGQARLPFTSNASRRPSPTKLSANSVIARAAHGNTTSHQSN